MYLGGVTIAASALPTLAQVTYTSAYLQPYLLQNSGGGQLYDLGLDRLSFTTGAPPSDKGLGGALDDLYDDPGTSGDLRTFLDELIVLPPGEAQHVLSELGGGTHIAFQSLSFNGLGKYLGVLNNHIGGGSGFASYMGTKSWYASNYPEGVQLAMAGGGNSMSDAAPVLLAAAGNLVGQGQGQGQIASGTNWGLWIDGYGSVGNRRSDDIISKYKQTLYGGMMGFDIRAAENLFVGISGGISRTNLDFDDLQDNGHMDSYHGSFYMVYDGKPWYAEGVFTYAYNKYDLERFITLGPTQVANSDYKGNEYTGYAEVGYKLDAGGVIIRPLAAFQADYLSQDGFVETGAGIYNLTVDKRNTGSYQSFLGVNISGKIKMGSVSALTPELRLKWAHEFSNDAHLINAQFGGMGSGSFTVEAEPLNRDTAVVGLGMNLRFNKHLAAYIQYDAELNRDFVNHTGLVGLRLEW
jgi:outer membrane autotransporter protein